MCLTSPSMPAPVVMPAPTPTQESKQPTSTAVGETAQARKANPMPASSGTLLTGPTGVEQSQLNLGKSSLLGG